MIKCKIEGRTWVHRKRLIAFQRINLLRLSIRRHLWKGRKGESPTTSMSHPDFSHAVRLCQTVAQETIDAITRYISLRTGARAFGLFSTMSLIECIYNLVALPSAPNTVDETPHCDSATASVQKAVRCIQALAQSKVRVAQSAYKVLGSFLKTGVCVQHRTPDHSFECTLHVRSKEKLIVFY